MKAKKPKSEEPCKRGDNLKSYDEQFFSKMASDLDKWSLGEDNIWLNDFFLEQGLISRQWSPWREKSEVFDQACIRALQRQESKLLRGGLKSKYNSSLTKSVLANIHGWEADQDAIMKSCLKGMIELMNQPKPKGSLIEDN